MLCARRVHFLLLIFFTFSGIPASNLAAQMITKIGGHWSTSAWTLHKSGRIFAAVKSTDSVIEYDLSGKKVRTIPVAPGPSGMIIKGDHLIVACQKTARISVINLKTNKVIGEIALEDKRPFGLFCSKIDNGLVYSFSKGEASARNNRKVVQIDLKQMEVRNKIPSVSWQSRYHSLDHIEMSSDGKWIVAAFSKSGLKGLRLISVDEVKGTFTHVRNSSFFFRQIQAGPSSRCWSFGGSIYSTDIKRKIRTFSGTHTAIHPEYDLAVSYSSEGLFLQQFSNAKLLKKIPMSLAAENIFFGFAFADSPYAVIAAGGLCQIVDLKQTKIPLHSLLLLEAPVSVELEVGEQMSIPISVTDKKLLNSVTVELKQGPEEAKLIENKLVWNPTSRQVGQHTVELVAKIGEKTIDKAFIDLNVNVEKITLDFNIASIDVDSEGKYAVVWGHKPKENERGSHDSNQHLGNNEVAVIDLESQTVIAHKSLNSSISKAVIQQPYVFLVQRSNNFLFRYNAKTLSDAKRMLFKGNVSFVNRHFNKQIAVSMGDSYLTLVDPESMEKTGSVNSQTLQKRLLNKEDGTIALLDFNPGITSLVPVIPESAFELRLGREYSRKTFGRFITSERITSATGAPILHIENKVFFQTPHHPVAFAVRVEKNPDNQGDYQAITYLETVSLVDGEVLDSRIINISARYDHYPHYYHDYRNSKVRPLKNKLLFYNVNSNELFVISNPIAVESAPQPIHFPTPTIPELNINRSQTISLKAIGGVGKLDYQLVTTYEGIEVDSSSGDVTIDTPLIWKNYLSAKIHQHTSSKHLRPERYKELFGKSPPANKLLFVLPIQLRVTDEESQEDQVTVFAIVHAKANRATSAEIRAMQTRQGKESRIRDWARREQIIEEMKKEGTTEVSVRENIYAQELALARRLRRLEEKLFTVLSKCKKLTNGQNGK